mgnify:CR=1 FL=1
MDLNTVDVQLLSEDEDYREEVLSTPTGTAIETLATAFTIDEVAILLAKERPDFLRRFLQWSKVTYPALQIDVDVVMTSVMRAVQGGNLQ